MKVGQRAFEAEHELEKLPGIIRSREKQLEGTLDSVLREKLDREVRSLEAQLERHRETLADLECEGRGFIAAGDPDAEALRAIEDAAPYAEVSQRVAVKDGKASIDGLLDVPADQFAAATADPERVRRILDFSRPASERPGAGALLRGLSFESVETLAEAVEHRAAGRTADAAALIVRLKADGVPGPAEVERLVRDAGRSLAHERRFAGQTGAEIIETLKPELEPAAPGVVRLRGVVPLSTAELERLAEADPKRLAAIVDVARRLESIPGAQQALAKMSPEDIEQVGDIIDAQVIRDHERSANLIRELITRGRDHEALNRVTRRAVKEIRDAGDGSAITAERTAKPQRPPPKPIASNAPLTDRYGPAFAKVMARTDIPEGLRREIEVVLGKIAESGRFDDQNVRQIVKALAAADRAGVGAHLAELEHGVWVVEQGRVQDGTRAFFGVKSGATVELAPGRAIELDGSHKGRTLIAEADVLYLGRDGKLNIDEVKDTVAALRDKMATAPKYIDDRQEWVDASPSDRAFSFIIDKEERWTDLFYDPQAGSRLAIKHLAESGLPLTIAGEEVDVVKLSNAADELGQVFQELQDSDPGLTWKRFFAERMATVEEGSRFVDTFRGAIPSDHPTQPPRPTPGARAALEHHIRAAAPHARARCR